MSPPSRLSRKPARPWLCSSPVLRSILPLGVVQQVQLGYQEGFVNSLWESAGRVLGLVGLLLVIYVKAGLVWLVLAMAGAPALAWLLNSLVLFGFRRPWLRPRFQNYHSASARKSSPYRAFFFHITNGRDPDLCLR